MLLQNLVLFRTVAQRQKKSYGLDPNQLFKGDFLRVIGPIWAKAVWDPKL